ncbi:MAG: flagellar hook-basal body complex protein, partial [candidate division Zixibacteria bacterium]|nr:flagellar hook basal-body protein [candidate division KSB1 bacterium]NIV06282.1 flagellar hook-basal body complex protein [candidate division Zixibacteria bacterium]NIS24420.1 flagellar hook basal-body protein [candidate division KSB1 bacterium]NIT71356.1 flagellar hook basal-body protein [candidate division KSB1 bacterium]NIU25035.1 flagellar hook basal-body protein [candidate division KSB1 bacterium]
STGNAKIDFSPGNLRKTDNPLDVAISGDGFFVVQTEEGNFYTRNGSFRLDATGRLVTQDGYSVLTDAGELQIHGGSVRLSESGEIVMNDQIVGRLRLVTFEDLRSLEKVGDAHFRLREGAELELPAAETNLRPGYLEGSNVNSISEMVSMIELNRQYELGQRAIKTQDETLERLINQAGRS